MFQASSSFHSSLSQDAFSPLLRHLSHRLREPSGSGENREALFEKLSQQVARSNNGTIHHNNLRYDSRSEVAIGRLLERFVEGFRVDLGRTFQVPIGQSSKGHVLTADFCIGNLLLEFHPPRLRASRGRPGDFENWRELKHYERLLEETDAEGRIPIRELFRVKCLKSYEEKRQHQIDQSGLHPGKELIVVGNALDFYDRVLCRIATQTLPPRSSFQALFNEELKVGKDVKPSKYQKSRRR